MVWNRYLRALFEYEKYAEETGILLEPLTYDINFWKFVIKFASVIKGSRILDVGCGTGWLVSMCDKYYACESIGVDASKKQLKIAQSSARSAHTHFICAMGEYLPFRDKVFDMVTCIETLDHVYSPSDMLKEIGE